MPRWEAGGIERLQTAALELFAEQGFEATTVAQIASRAGLTKRSFFNHFSDKREVLFQPLSGRQGDLVLQKIDLCAEAMPPLDVVVVSLQHASEEMFEPRQALVTRRAQIIEASPELRERELSKRDALTEAIAAALRERGLDQDTALLTARTGMLIHQTAMRRWTQVSERDSLRQCYDSALASLCTTMNTGGPNA